MEMVQEFSKQNKEAEKRFYEFEEKRMKLEAKLEEDQRKREWIMNATNVYEVTSEDDVSSC